MRVSASRAAGHGGFGDVGRARVGGVWRGLVGNRTSIDAPLSRNTANVYDALNRLKQIADPAEGVTNFVYDANDDLPSVTDPKGLVTSYGYDDAGRLTAATAVSGTPMPPCWSYGHDSLDRVISASSSAGVTQSFTYDADGNRLRSR
jgi:YD repeat-containing protein